MSDEFPFSPFENWGEGGKGTPPPEGEIYQPPGFLLEFANSLKGKFTKAQFRQIATTLNQSDTLVDTSHRGIGSQDYKRSLSALLKGTSAEDLVTQLMAFENTWNAKHPKEKFHVDVTSADSSHWLQDLTEAVELAMRSTR